MSEYIRSLREKIGHDLILQPSVACLIRHDDGRVLLVQSVEGRWTLPAGAVDPGETPAEAACRETYEEASIEVEVRGVVGVFGGYPEHHICYPNGDEAAWVATVFEAHITNGVPAPGDDETRAVRWVTPAEAFALELSPATRHMLMLINQGISFN